MQLLLCIDIFKHLVCYNISMLGMVGLKMCLFFSYKSQIIDIQCPPIGEISMTIQIMYSVQKLLANIFCTRLYNIEYQRLR